MQVMGKIEHVFWVIGRDRPPSEARGEMWSACRTERRWKIVNCAKCQRDTSIDVVEKHEQ